MGHFEKSIPVHRIEFDERNIYFDKDRYTKPFINEAVLWEYFGPETEIVKSIYFEETKQGRFQYQRICKYTKKSYRLFRKQNNRPIDIKSREVLMNLISNLILFEVEGSEGRQFHFRFSMETTSSFRYLDWHLQNQLRELYINYFFQSSGYFLEERSHEKTSAFEKINQYAGMRRRPWHGSCLRA